ncbi:TetR/AcrR family transcriptional regulator [Amycolatopsis sp. K13G38]|uniref:TetR/AcrR family transcriptional regulator n=1 Tax=Amycolatopsis acididurans TaxID=2724524 RepID=A0ABX1JDW0_9PSEU|nr:TetR/AcrR family transcriptional regulator [Amycolatopsis acididurans]NKQ56870.1 TetR/AcrR family transcriptional regulator [Amycolatopsis acididurans]
MTSSPGRMDGRAARWAGQRERRRREFVAAALRAIAQHGPEVSTEQIAEEAGVARTRVYKYFADGADLQIAIAARVGELITAELAPVWTPRGTPMQMIEAGVEAHTRWLADNENLYRYLTMHSLSGQDAIADVKTTIATNLTGLFDHYLRLFGLDARLAEPIAFGVVGLVESAAARWLANPSGLTRDELAALLTRWVWRLLDDMMRAGGVELDPHRPLPGAQV